MGRLIAIGVIHGRPGKLEGLLAQVAPSSDDRLVFLGDYIDCGPDSFAVVDCILAWAAYFGPQTEVELSVQRVWQQD